MQINLTWAFQRDCIGKRRRRRRIFFDAQINLTLVTQQHVLPIKFDGQLIWGGGYTLPRPRNPPPENTHVNQSRAQKRHRYEHKK